MRQLVQRAKDGRIEVVDVPAPILLSVGVLVRTAYSVISPGTERQRLVLARKSLVAKARARPDLVRQVLTRVKQDGILSTYRRVRFRLTSPLALGYSSAGTVIAVGADVRDLCVGDRVACAGAGFANHAEIAFIPGNLCVRVPESLRLEQAAFGTLGAIAMQGVRQAELRVGETVAIIGLGLIGLLSVIVAKAAGCKVVGIDPVQARRDLALRLGAEQVAAEGHDAVTAVRRVNREIGADAVLICASTSSDTPVALAARLARDRARVVVVGMVGMRVPRQPYYDKELTVKLSRSYGPGRYDPAYEMLGHDYPVGYVRWTERRNLESFLEVLARDPESADALISRRFPVQLGDAAYELLRSDTAAIGILLEYGQAPEPERRERILISHRPRGAAGSVRVGVIGAGNFAQGVLLPLLARRSGVQLHAVATASGLSARAVADRYGSRYVTADYNEILRDSEIDCVVICTRHDTHASILVEALRLGKDSFVEKPLAIAPDELTRILTAAEASSARFMVGFNRRYSPMLREVRAFLGQDAGPLLMHYRVNAGQLATDHWLQDQAQGGRLRGEVCHFVDSLQYLAGAEPVRVFAERSAGAGRGDDVVALLTFANGSLGSITYATHGDGAAGKERLEVFGGGKMAVVDDFQRCTLNGAGRTRRLRTLTPAKGHAEEVDQFLRFVKTGELETPPRESIMATRATLAIEESLSSGKPVCL